MDTSVFRCPRDIGIAQIEYMVNINPRHVDGWLHSDPADLAVLYRILDDKRPPFYEHRLTA